MRSRHPEILLVVVVVLAMHGCGNSETAEEPLHRESFALLDLTLDGAPDPETVGLLTAANLGQFREAGIGLAAVPPLTPGRPIKYVVEGVADIVVSYEPQVVLSHEKGLPVVAFGSLVPHSTMAMIWLPESGIDDIGDLKGKVIAIPGVPFQRDFLKAALERNGVAMDEVKIVVGGSELATVLAEGKADAIFGGSRNVEGAALEARGLNPVFTEAAELGIPEYDELVFVARQDRLARNPGLFRRFVEVATAGGLAAREDPKAGYEAIASHSLGETAPQGTRAGLKATFPLLSESGQIDTERTTDLIAWMHQEGMIKREPKATEVLFER